MSNYTHLIGAEEVGRAGYAMRDAASAMQSAASSFSSDVDRLVRALDDHASRMEALKEQQA